MTVMVHPSPVFLENLEKIRLAGNSASINRKIEDFIRFKFHNPLERFNNSDRAFSADGVYGNLRLRKAHVSDDLSIIYSIRGDVPKHLELLAVMSHSQLGTGTPSNIRRQQQVARRLSELLQIGR